MDTADDSLVTFWGRIDADGTGDVSTPGGLINLKAHLSLDEDVGAGGTDLPDEEGQDVAPWLSVNKSIPDGASIELMYIVYHTSEYETLIGGNDACSYDPAIADCTAAAATGLEKLIPDFSNAEDKADAKLVVEARADGRDGRWNLRLHETGRFTGRYEGYLKLTDENGGGVDADGWGLTVRSAVGSNDDGAAVIGVESGPVVIAYKDTDGSTKLREIDIDTVPPAITIDTPTHESQGQDTSPEFAGSFLDRDSGLRGDSFALYVDHVVDANENGGKSGDQFALDLRVDTENESGDAYGVVEALGRGKEVVESLEDYVGYSADNPTYAVIDHTDVFFGLVDNYPETDKRLVEGDNFDDWR